MTAPIEDVSSLPGKKITDQEVRSDRQPYAPLVPEDTDGSSQRVEDADNLETPDPDRRTEETKERLHDPGGSSTRDVDAGKIADQNAELGGGDDDEGDDEKDGGEEETAHR